MSRQTDPDDGTNWDKLRAMTPAEAEAAAWADPDARPLPEGRPRQRMAVSKRLRLHLMLTHDEFAARYQFPLADIVAWERYESKPGQIAIAYLAAIAADPEGVANAVAKVATQIAAE